MMQPAQHEKAARLHGRNRICGVQHLSCCAQLLRLAYLCHAIAAAEEVTKLVCTPVNHARASLVMLFMEETPSSGIHLGGILENVRAGQGVCWEDWMVYRPVFRGLSTIRRPAGLLPATIQIVVYLLI